MHGHLYCAPSCLPQAGTPPIPFQAGRGTCRSSWPSFFIQNLYLEVKPGHPPVRLPAPKTEIPNQVRDDKDPKSFRCCHASELVSASKKISGEEGLFLNEKNSDGNASLFIDQCFCGLFLFLISLLSLHSWRSTFAFRGVFLRNHFI